MLTRRFASALRRWPASNSRLMASGPRTVASDLPGRRTSTVASARGSVSTTRDPFSSSRTNRANRGSSVPGAQIIQSPVMRKCTCSMEPSSRTASWCFPRRSTRRMRWPARRRRLALVRWRPTYGWKILARRMRSPDAARASVRAACSTSGSSGMLEITKSEFRCHPERSEGSVQAG